MSDLVNAKKIITFAAKLANIAGMVFEDGKITSADLSQLPDELDDEQHSRHLYLTG